MEGRVDMKLQKFLEKYYKRKSAKCLHRIEKQNKRYMKYLRKSKIRAEQIAQQIEEYETEEGQEKIWQEKYIKSKAYIAIVIGFIMLVATFFLTYVCEISDWDDTYKKLCSSFITVLNSTFGIILGIGISTLVLDFFSYIKYTRNRIKEIMLDKAYIETLSEKEKRKLIEKAEKSLYFRNGEVTDNSLYANIKELIIPLIEVNYYKQYKVHVDCYIDESKGIMRKRVHKIMDVMCINDKEFKIPFSTYMEKIDGMDNKELYDIAECTFNSVNITQEVRDKVIMTEVDDPNKPSGIKFNIDHTFCLNKGLNRIEIRTETIVPIKDNTYSHTIIIPCQRYSSNFSIHNPDYEVIGYGFAFDDENHKSDIDKIIYADRYDDCFKIRFENWILPGDGVVFVINKK